MNRSTVSTEVNSAFGLGGQVSVELAGVPAASEIELVQLDLEKWQKFLPGVERLVLYRIPLRHNFRGIWERNGLLFKGAAGWSEFAPFWNYVPAEATRWFESGLNGATSLAPAPLKDKIPVNVTVPVVEPEQAVKIVENSGGCRTAKIKIASNPNSQAADLERVRAVQAVLADKYGNDYRIRVDINAIWTLAEAREKLPALNEAAGGLEYAEQPCADPNDLVKLRADRICPIAADESIRRSPQPLADLPMGAADVIVIKVQPLGGVAAAVKVAKQAAKQGIKTVISSALDSAVGIYQGCQAAAALDSQDLACGLASGQLFVGDVTGQRVQVKDGFLPLTAPVIPDDLPLLRQAKLADTALVAAAWHQRVAEIWAIKSC